MPSEAAGTKSAAREEPSTASAQPRPICPLLPSGSKAPGPTCSFGRPATMARRASPPADLGRWANTWAPLFWGAVRSPVSCLAPRGCELPVGAIGAAEDEGDALPGDGHVPGNPTRHLASTPLLGVAMTQARPKSQYPQLGSVKCCSPSASQPLPHRQVTYSDAAEGTRPSSSPRCQPGSHGGRTGGAPGRHHRRHSRGPSRSTLTGDARHGARLKRCGRSAARSATIAAVSRVEMVFLDRQHLMPQGSGDQRGSCHGREVIAASCARATVEGTRRLGSAAQVAARGLLHGWRASERALNSSSGGRMGLNADRHISYSVARR